MFPIIEKTLSTGADVPGKDIANSTILEILLASHKILKPRTFLQPRTALKNQDCPG
jgi:hypothetical protein